MTASENASSKPKHPYIVQSKEVCGGKPVIAGTRIKVAQIVIEYDWLGWSADEIVQAHPHLTLAQVHDALSYYYENTEAINADIRSEKRLIEELRKQYPRSILEEKRGGA